MNIVVAIDSLKGSLTSIEAGNAIRDGILRVMPDSHVQVKPLADGGEGTTEALVQGLGGEMIEIDVHGPLQAPVHAAYGMLGDTAIMEMASAAGIALVGKDLRPLETTTYGVGEMIRDAIERGCRKFLVGIGGSATNDGGIGMLTALGYEFLDSDGTPVGICTRDLANIASVKTEHRMPQLEACKFQIACDVTNPLCGENGATYVYGPQKGVTEGMRAELDAAMEHYAFVTKEYLGVDNAKAAGAGAAGGLGYAFLSYLQGELQPGIELVMEAVDMEQAIQQADLVFTGEGRLDRQSAMGKAPVGVATLAKKYGVNVIALAGSVTDDAAICNERGIDAFFPILRNVVTLDEAMQPETARKNLCCTAEQVMRLIAAFQ